MNGAIKSESDYFAVNQVMQCTPHVRWDTVLTPSFSRPSHSETAKKMQDNKRQLRNEEEMFSLSNLCR